MATTVPKTLNFIPSLSRLSTDYPFPPSNLVCVSLVRRQSFTTRCRLTCSKPYSHGTLRKFVCFNSNGEATVAEDEKEVEEIQETLEDVVDTEDGTSEGDINGAEQSTSSILTLLQSYKEALANNEEPKVVEIEATLKSIEDENLVLEKQVATLSDELSYERDRVLRISADFDNFRKRTERERLSLVSNAKGEVVENLLAVLDNFERAKAQIKVESEKEEKINNSYQSIYKQFVEILGSLGVVTVETIGKPFDPMLHEAIMREDSEEFEEGIILQEFRKGFKLGDRLLRPSMVKVSAGPGPAKTESVTSQETDSAEGPEPSVDVPIDESSDESSEPDSSEDD